MVNEIPKISVIIPVYNTEKYLPACLDSLANQTFKDFEAIIIDNNSIDKSAEIIEKYTKLYPNFKTYKRIGGWAGGARNEGLKHAKGTYVFFLDSDDTLNADALNILYNTAKKYNADIVNCNFNKINTEISVCNEYKNNSEQGFSICSKKDGQIAILRYLSGRAGTCGKLINRNIFSEHNLTFPEGVPSEDVALISTCSLFTENFYQLNIPLYNYRYVENSLSNSKRELAPKSLFNNFALLRPKLEQYPFFKNEIKEEWEYRLISMIIGGEGCGNGGLKNLSKERIKEFFNLSKEFYLTLPKDFFKKRNLVFRLKYYLFLFALKNDYYNMHKLTRGFINLFYTFYKLFNRSNNVYK